MSRPAQVPTSKGNFWWIVLKILPVKHDIPVKVQQYLRCNLALVADKGDFADGAKEEFIH